MFHKAPDTSDLYFGSGIARTSHLLPFPDTKVDEPSAERLAFLERERTDPIARRVFPGTKIAVFVSIREICGREVL